MPTFKHDATGKRFFFAHIPRTAGRFVEYNLVCVEKNDCRWDPDEQFKMDNGFGIMSVRHGAEVAHYHKELYEEYLDVKDIPHISVIRNPIDKFFSASSFFKRMYGDDIQEAMEDPIMFHSMLDNFPLTEAVNWFRPQMDFLTDDTNIWKFEDGFGDDFSEWMSDIIGYKFTIKELDENYIKNGAGQKLNLEYFDKETLAKNKLDKTAKLVNNITALYRKDIEQLYPELATPFEEGT